MADIKTETKKPKHVDFNAIARNLRKQGAFRPDAPHSEAAGQYPHLPRLRLPGDTYAPTLINALHEPRTFNAPQEMIAEQLNSARKALLIYFPADTVVPWMHEYFNGDFIRSQSMQLLCDYYFQGIPKPKEGQLDPSLDFQLHDARRRGDSTRLYTHNELVRVRQIVSRQPEIATTLLAYQSAFIEYLYRLEDEVVRPSTQLSLQEKKHALDFTNLMIANVLQTAFLFDLVPAIALHYDVNHRGQLSAAPTAADYRDGMDFAIKNGALRLSLLAPDGQPRHSACPAAAQVAMSNAASPSPLSGSTWNGLGQIHQKVKALIDESSPHALQITRALREWMVPAWPESHR